MLIHKSKHETLIAQESNSNTGSLQDLSQQDNKKTIEATSNHSEVPQFNAESGSQTAAQASQNSEPHFEPNILAMSFVPSEISHSMLPPQPLTEQPPSNPAEACHVSNSLLLGYQPKGQWDTTSDQQQKQRIDTRNLQYRGTVEKFIRKKGGNAFGFIDSICEKDTGQQWKTQDETKKGGNYKKADDMFFSFNEVQSNLLDLQRGDVVEFRIFLSKKFQNSKQKAANVTVVKLTKRSHRTLLEYIKLVKKLLYPEEKPNPWSYDWTQLKSRFGFGFDSDFLDEGDGRRKEGDTDEEYVPRHIMKLLSSPTVWQCVAEQISTLEEEKDEDDEEDCGDAMLEEFLEVILMLHQKIRTLDERFRQVNIILVVLLFYLSLNILNSILRVQTAFVYIPILYTPDPAPCYIYP